MNIFAGKDVKTWEEARDIFFAQGENDARAVCFLALLDDEADDDVRAARLRRSAETGYAFAQAELAGWLPEDDEDEKEECFRFASLAASQGDRDGSFWLGYCFNHGVDVVRKVWRKRRRITCSVVRWALWIQ